MQAFENMLKEKDIVLSPLQIKQFHTYFDTLIDWNNKINLTAITEMNQVYLKHFYDSITASFYFDFNSITSLCDVGSGAGFPSIPLKIIYPHLEISIVDSLNKRIHFLEELTNKLGLKDVFLYHDRAETFARKQGIRESFDFVTARAVANLSTLSEYCLPLNKIGSIFLAMKGATGEEELNTSAKAIDILGGQVSQVEKLFLPEENSERYLIYIKKVKHTTKKYPRKPGTPSRQPL